MLLSCLTTRFNLKNSSKPERLVYFSVQDDDAQDELNQRIKKSRLESELNTRKQAVPIGKYRRDMKKRYEERIQQALGENDIERAEKWMEILVQFEQGIAAKDQKKQPEIEAREINVEKKKNKHRQQKQSDIRELTEVGQKLKLTATSLEKSRSGEKETMQKITEGMHAVLEADTVTNKKLTSVIEKLKAAGTLKPDQIEILLQYPYDSKEYTELLEKLKKTAFYANHHKDFEELEALKEKEFEISSQAKTYLKQGCDIIAANYEHVKEDVHMEKNLENLRRESGINLRRGAELTYTHIQVNEDGRIIRSYRKDVIVDIRRRKKGEEGHPDDIMIILKDGSEVGGAIITGSRFAKWANAADVVEKIEDPKKLEQAAEKYFEEINLKVKKGSVFEFQKTVYNPQTKRLEEIPQIVKITDIKNNYIELDKPLVTRSAADTDELQQDEEKKLLSYGEFLRWMIRQQAINHIQNKAELKKALDYRTTARNKLYKTRPPQDYPKIELTAGEVLYADDGTYREIVINSVDEETGQVTFTPLAGQPPITVTASAFMTSWVRKYTLERKKDVIATPAQAGGSNPDTKSSNDGIASASGLAMTSASSLPAAANNVISITDRIKAKNDPAAPQNRDPRKLKSKVSDILKGNTIIPVPIPFPINKPALGLKADPNIPLQSFPALKVPAGAGNTQTPAAPPQPTSTLPSYQPAPGPPIPEDVIGPSGWDTSKVKKIWLETRFLSVLDCWNAIKAFWEFLKRKHERKSKERHSSVLKNLPGQVGTEYKRINQQAENEEVNQYKESFSQMGVPELEDILYRTKSRDETKAILITLVDKGQVRWDDPGLWKTLNKFGNGNPKWVRKEDDCEAVINALWGEDQFREWYNQNESRLRSNRDAYTELAKKLSADPKGTGGLRGELKNMLQAWKEGQYVDRAKYESMIHYAIKAGKLNFNDKLYYLIMGAGFKNPSGKTIYHIDRITVIVGENLQNYPVADFFGETPWKRADYERWVKDYCTLNADETPYQWGAKFDKWASDFIYWNPAFHTRLSKSSRTAEWDHDDMHIFAPFLKEDEVDGITTERHGSQSKLTKDGHKNAYAGMNEQIKRQVQRLATCSPEDYDAHIKRLASLIRTFIRFDGIMSGRMYQSRAERSRLTPQDIDALSVVDANRFVRQHVNESRDFVTKLISQLGNTALSKQFNQAYAPPKSKFQRIPAQQQEEAMRSLGENLEYALDGFISQAGGKDRLRNIVTNSASGLKGIVNLVSQSEKTAAEKSIQAARATLAKPEISNQLQLLKEFEWAEATNPQTPQQKQAAQNQKMLGTVEAMRRNKQKVDANQQNFELINEKDLEEVENFIKSTKSRKNLSDMDEAA